MSTKNSILNLSGEALLNVIADAQLLCFTNQLEQEFGNIRLISVMRILHILYMSHYLPSFWVYLFYYSPQVIFLHAGLRGITG